MFSTNKTLLRNGISISTTHQPLSISVQWDLTRLSYSQGLFYIDERSEKRRVLPMKSTFKNWMF